MKILHVNKFFDLQGGAEAYMHGLMREQEKMGHEIHALSTRSPSNLLSRDAARFVTRYDLKKSHSPLAEAKIAANFFWNREARRAMDAALSELKPDIVHLHNLYHHLSSSVLFSIRRAGAPCVQTLHDLKLACPNYRMYTEGNLCERCKGGHYTEAIKHRCLTAAFTPNVLAAFEMGFTKLTQAYERTVHTFICPSRFMAEKMKEWGEPPSKFRVVAPPVIFPPAVAARGGGYLLAVGRLSPEKGYDLLLRAAAHVPTARILIAGAGPEEDRLRAFLQTQKIKNVELVGKKQRDDLVKLYSGAEGFIACPVGYENAPLSVLDALGYGLPVLAARIGGLPEMVEDGVNGYLVERGSADAWIVALKKFEDLSPATREAMAQASRRLAEKNFTDWRGHAARIEEMYKSAI